MSNLALFEFELPENTDPEDDTRITLVNLYFSQVEKSRFNELCKKGMVALYGEKAKESNAVDFMLDLLERTFGDRAPIATQAIDTSRIIEALEKAKNAINEVEDRFKTEAQQWQSNG